MIHLIKSLKLTIHTKFNKGFSYIEVLISSTLLSVFSFAVVFVIFHVNSSQLIIYRSYQKVQLSNSLLVEVSNTISSLNNPIEMLNSFTSVQGLLNSNNNPTFYENFYIRYRKDLFEYIVDIQGQNTSIRLYSNNLYTYTDTILQHTYLNYDIFFTVFVSVTATSEDGNYITANRYIMLNSGLY